MKLQIFQAQQGRLEVLTDLALALWPDHDWQEMRHDLQQQMEKPGVAFFLAYSEEVAVGFAQCQLRHDYVEGTDSSPVGYLEGIYVARECRGRGIAKQLLRACEAWAKAAGCSQFASDCELHNTESLRFHQKMGFAEANRIICFVKEL